MLLGGYIDSLGYLEGNGPSDFPKVLFYGTHCRGGIMHSRAKLSKCDPGILGCQSLLGYLQSQHYF